MSYPTWQLNTAQYVSFCFICVLDIDKPICTGGGRELMGPLPFGLSKRAKRKSRLQRHTRRLRMAASTQTVQ
ncbi:unnamed protein product [Dicrocoelium dendriticum]|nr:unnamed protein product [Dicrocoelium dendriticum]